MILTALGGGLLTVNWFVFIYVINHIDIQTGSFSYLLCPILTALLAYLFSEVLVESNSGVADGVRRALGREPRDFATFARDAARAGAWDSVPV